MTTEYLRAPVAKWVAKPLYLLAPFLPFGRKGQVTGSISPDQLPKGIYGNAGRGIFDGPEYFDTDMAEIRAALY